MISKLSIWNMALGFVGTRTIASENEKNLEAIQCELYWDSARRGALRDYPWNFAQRRVWLAKVDLPTGYAQQYAYAYAVPEDMLLALRIYPHGKDYANHADAKSGRFIIVYDGENKKPIILSNTASALLAYTADISDTTIFDDLFAHMLARKLAALIAVSLLKNNSTKIQELEQLYRAAIPNAMQANAREGKEQEKVDTWLLTRGESYAHK